VQIGGAKPLGKCSLCRAECLVEGRDEGIGVDPGTHHLTEVFHAAGEGMPGADNQPVDPIGRELSHTEADPSTHGVTPVVGLFGPYRIENGDNIADARFQ
jgi:hypothetical protein